MDRRTFLKTGTATTAVGLGAIPFIKFMPAEAAGRSGTLVVVSGQGPNSLDIHRTGSNRPSYQISTLCYDRLVGFGTKPGPDGAMMYDYATITPELAESWTIADDRMSVTFNLRKDATFWDGSPVTADDVKWSLDRAVSVGGFPAVQMKAGVLVNREQFVVVDKHTFRINFIRPSKLTLPDLAVPVPQIYNSKVAKAHATEKDPWALEWLYKNAAGGGAYMLERWDPGQQVVFKRFDKWKSGPLPAIERVILREVPSQSTRRALIVRGDADLSLEMPAKDTAELRKDNKLKIVGNPVENCVHAVGLNLTFAPFKDKRVRQAIAYALPYEKIFNAAAFGQGVPMWGGKSFTPADISWPQPFPYTTDLDKAKSLLKAAGYESGFEVPLSFNLGVADWSEPTVLLIQEELAKIGIKTPIDKIPGSSFRQKALVEKALPFHLKNFGGWLNYPDYYFFWVLLEGHLFNSMHWKNETFQTLVPPTLDMPVDDPQYVENIKKMLAIFFDEVPMIPLYQPTFDVAMQKNVENYTFYFHKQLDARWLKKA